MVREGETQTARGAALKELGRLPQWVGWRYEARPNGKQGKAPINPATGTQASSTNPCTWGDYAQAVAAAEEHGHDGVGFVFTPDDPYVGIDLDDCVQDGEVAPWAEEIVRVMDSYAEVSPSGTGIKIWLRGAKPGSRSRTGNIEIYDAGRFFAFTGRMYGTRHGIENRQDALDELYRQLFPEQEARAETIDTTRGGFGGSDEALLRKARRAKTGAGFVRLYYRGDWEEFETRSQADWDLLKSLAFWTARDAKRMRRLFLGSALAPALGRKSDPEGYLDLSIGNAIKGCRKVYDPNYRTG